MIRWPRHGPFAGPSAHDVQPGSQDGPGGEGEAQAHSREHGSHRPALGGDTHAATLRPDPSGMERETRKAGL